ncbi:MAG: GNAT family N-acetyltransferase [Polyangiaceae bacterium]|nr:GNAT family N-acetyltransferase [Polyangiaceae bacterium]
MHASVSAAISPRVVLATTAEQMAAEELVRATRVEVNVPDELSRSFARLWLAFCPDDTRAAGLLLAWIAADELHVIDVVTRPEHRRRGVGTTLIATALAAGAARNLRLALLEVRAKNETAIRLYAAAGFAAYNVRRRYYADGEDALEMSLSFASRPELHP